jgi:hypothetical protein
MATTSLVKKLLIKPGQRMLIINAPPEYGEKLAPLPDGVELADKPEGVFDFVQLFAKNSDELHQYVSTAINAVKHEGLLWISYPKGSSKVKTDLNRDILWAAVEPFGFKGVSLISLDDIWSAMRFRPDDLVGR